MMNLVVPQLLGAVSPTTKMVDDLFIFVLIISVIFFVLITGGITLLVILYRRRGKPGITSRESASHHTGLEITWSVIPAIIVLVIFIWGFQVFMQLNVAPGDAMEVRVTARKWSWLFTYPEGARSSELRVPVGQPVKLIMSSDDVIHSLSIPAFRTKMDVLPYRYTSLWFRADKVGEYDLFCTEFCGDNHSRMYSKVIVMPRDKYQKWIEENAGAVASGDQLYTMFGCNACHSIDGVDGPIGPTFSGLFGKTRVFTDGSTAVADENYLRESILEPNAKVVQGFLPVMPAQPGITTEELDALIDFIKSLKE